MDNFGKYKDSITRSDFALVNGEIKNCSNVRCIKECDFYSESEECTKIKWDWLKAEYVEPKINIPEGTPIDTKVLVSTNGIDWYKRHYAGFKDGEYYAWNDGRTSFTIVDAEYSKRQKSNKRAWDYMKLYE